MSMIYLFSTQNYCGGRVLSMDFIQKVNELCKENDIKLHLDGSRVLNAAVASNTDPKEICKYFNSINLCLSKGVGAPVGSILTGDREFIERAARARQVLGGAMRQSGVLAAAALVGLGNIDIQLRKDHENAKLLAEGIQAKSNGLLFVDVSNIQTNIIHARITNKRIDSNTLLNRLIQITDDEQKALTGRFVVRLGYIDKYNLRILTHCDVNTNDILMAIKKINYVTNELIKNLD
jgi:threonine aldolase